MDGSETTTAKLGLSGFACGRDYKSIRQTFTAQFQCLPCQRKKAIRTSKLEVPTFPSGHLAQYISIRAERRLPVPDKKDDTGYFLTGKCKKSEAESMVLLETFCS